MIKAIYKRFGDKLPTRGEYMSLVDAPVPFRELMRAYGGVWSRFERAYALFCESEAASHKAKPITQPVRPKSVELPTRPAAPKEITDEA